VNEQRPSGLATAGYIVLTVLLGLTLAYGAFELVRTVADATGDNGHLGVETIVREADVSSPELGPGVEPRGDLPVTVRIDEPTFLQVVLSVTKTLVPIMVGLAALWLVWGVARSVRAGDPFGTANVRRLRRLGYLVLLAAALLPVVSSALQEALFATSNAAGDRLDDGTIGTGGVAFDTAPVVVGLCVLVLAEVFAHGVRLREDVEGTV
jgi:hypothetical protein